MRLFIVGALVLLTSTAAAQSRWTVSTGPEWSRGEIAALRTWGIRFRAEYDLTRPNSVLGLRLESGARWSPTQGYLWNSFVGTVSGVEQKFDLMLGLNASLSPMPRARVSPYFTAGIFGRQEWIRGSRSYEGSPPPAVGTQTHGDIIGAFGVGLRARPGGRTFQLEYRRLHSQASVMLGTRLPF